MVMLRFSTRPDTPAADAESGDDGPAVEAAREWASLDGDCAPALARHFRITDLQHWLDLCA
jgi:hypothetical protein